MVLLFKGGGGGSARHDTGESGFISSLSLEWWLEIIGSGTGSNPKWQSLGLWGFCSKSSNAPLSPPPVKTKPKFKQWSHKVICLRGWKSCDFSLICIVGRVLWRGTRAPPPASASFPRLRLTEQSSFFCACFLLLPSVVVFFFNLMENSVR